MLKRPAKILRIITRMNIGGPAIQVTNLQQNLSTEMYQQLLVTGYCDQNEKDYLETHDLKLNLQRNNNFVRTINPLRDLIALYQVRRVIKQFKPAIIHTHTFKAGLIGRIAARSVSRRILLVHTFHGHLLHGYFGKLGTMLVITSERLLARVSTKLISVGTKVRDELLEHGVGNLEQYEVISPGFKLTQPQELSRSTFGFDDHDFLCGWFGRITKIKRADRILEICKLIDNRDGDGRSIKFLIVGDGDERREIEDLAKLLRLPITFLGWQADVPSLMQMCDVILCTSENEGTPLSLIEAQMLGRPVISTKVGSVQDVVDSGNSGIVLDYDPQLFWNEIEKLSKNQVVYEKMSQKAFNFALENFSLERFLAQHNSIYTEMLSIHSTTDH